MCMRRDKKGVNTEIMSIKEVWEKNGRSIMMITYMLKGSDLIWKHLAASTVLNKKLSPSPCMTTGVGMAMTCS